MFNQFTKFGITCILFLLVISCSKKAETSLPAGLLKSNMGGRPPSYVQKAWDARYAYDADRRLLVPEYAGSKWGAVQQFKEEGNLVYQDWWIRDVRKEELEESPETEITSFIDEDGNLTVPFYLVDQNGTEESVDEVPEDNNQQPVDEPADFPSEPLEPSPFLPF